jgi:hypothetical protein
MLAFVAGGGQLLELLFLENGDQRLVDFGKSEVVGDIDLSVPFLKHPATDRVC